MRGTPAGTVGEMHGEFVLFAHAGGWDEALLVLLPVAVFGGLLWLGNRRAQRHLMMPDDPAGHDPPGPGN